MPLCVVDTSYRLPLSGLKRTLICGCYIPDCYTVFVIILIVLILQISLHVTVVPSLFI